MPAAEFVHKLDKAVFIQMRTAFWSLRLPHINMDNPFNCFLHCEKQATRKTYMTLIYYFQLTHQTAQISMSIVNMKAIRTVITFPR